MSDMPNEIKVWKNNYPLVAATHLADDGLYGLDGETYYRGDLVDQLIEAAKKISSEYFALGVGEFGPLNSDEVEMLKRQSDLIDQLQGEGVSEDG